MTGASVSDKVKTVYVDEFRNLSDLILPTLSQEFTTGLQDKIETNIGLNQQNDAADVEFLGSIVKTFVNPVASGGDDIAGLNRLTVSIRVDFTNNVDDETWSQTFTRFADFPRSTNLNAVEATLVENIVNQLVQDVFNKAFVNW